MCLGTCHERSEETFVFSPLDCAHPKQWFKPLSLSKALKVLASHDGGEKGEVRIVAGHTARGRRNPTLSDIITCNWCHML